MSAFWATGINTPLGSGGVKQLWEWPSGPATRQLCVPLESPKCEMGLMATPTCFISCLQN